MKVNIFSIDADQIDACKSKLVASNMQLIKKVTQDGWEGEFYFSKTPAPTRVTWAKIYKPYFDELGTALPMNRNHFAAFVFTKDTTCYAISYGKTHFYLRPYCDYDFGIEVAKRVANEDDTRLTASRRFQGTRKKDIRSFATNTRLDVESGESVDYLQCSVIAIHQPHFGKTGKFGSSVQLTPDIEPAGLGKFLSRLEAELEQDARFALPRTTIITEKDEVARFDDLLLDELTSEIGTSEFSQNSFDLYGVDFVFSSDGTFTIRGPGRHSAAVEQLTMKELKLYVDSNKIARQDILRIKIDHDVDDGPGFSAPLKELVDFIPDNERVVLTGGKWMRFNQDYLDFLDGFLAEIEVEETEPEFKQISQTETDFNVSDAIKQAGYTTADKDFSIFKTRAKTPIEAWDLSKNSRVYAVKFGTPQKLNYVCDQATGLLEMLRNRAGVKQVPAFDSYCLWLGYRSQKDLGDITQTGSIILKQKIETWARKAREVGVTPVLKISRRMKEGVDD